ncbi:DEAD/DEAH box helicase [Arthrobacter sp. zg-Y895]|uniref:DEAD/DEAH box helicase n=1 Tax=Arthrobacter sp. zg-Y895 TaxID=2886933 RepID=UPI001D147DF7|nr:DEAD/DEAH box helicase [Arthrobacter sp. zg-Y895]MCC3300674.1 DEAD/DEAH box helicase [Arthrobacter sp. zg-Y895]
MIEINEEILDSEVFRELRAAVLGEFDRTAFPSASFERSYSQIDWDLALFLTSALEEDGSASVQQAVMDISFGALQSATSTAENKTAAALLLERFGNWPSIALAMKRDRISEYYRRSLPLPLRLDSVAAKLEHTIQPIAGEPFLGSDFQKRFWRESGVNGWLSVSAPTSAGKSYVVKRWVIDQAVADDRAVVLYVVPTRALVDEVTKELLDEPELKSVHIHSIPWDSSLVDEGPRILVMTQERVQITLDRFRGLIPTAAFFDEAQKIGEGYRGILLEEVLQEAVRRNKSLRAVFASPMTENPEALLTRSASDEQTHAFVSPVPSVSQNLYWVNPVPRHAPKWKIERSEDGEMQTIAEVSLGEEPHPRLKRLAAIPAKLSGPDALNIVYANTPSDAETCAKQIFEYLGPEAELHDVRIQDLQDLIRKSVHSSYLLAELVARGVAFHYGNMPQPVRQGVEALYRQGLIRFLVCTSTLLEGVNLPCTNIWIMNPRRGKGNPMTAFDFWNLAGRAGRWGSEFAGNIICIGTRANGGWTNPAPTKRSSGRISFATETKVLDSKRITDFINRNGEHERGTRKDEDLEALAAHLFDAAARKESSIALRALPAAAAADVADAFELKESELIVPERVRRSHPGINPQAMQRLLEDLRTKDPDSLPLLSPHDEGAFERLVRVLARCERNLRAGFGVPGNQARLSVLLLNWMTGRPIPWLISERINYERRNNPDTFSTAKCIRGVLEDVEQVARFRAPKYLACYSDIVDVIVPPQANTPPRPDVTMMLELGVSRPTDVSLMSLGLSRTATTLISEFIADERLTTAEAVAWLSGQNLSSLGVPTMIVREVDEVLRRVELRSASKSS